VRSLPGIEYTTAVLHSCCFITWLLITLYVSVNQAKAYRQARVVLRSPPAERGTTRNAVQTSDRRCAELAGEAGRTTSMSAFNFVHYTGSGYLHLLHSDPHLRLCRAEHG
jgi:hypothetical protein